jgi:hypothetical protein
MNQTQETLEEIAKETKRARVLLSRFMIYFVIWTWTPIIAFIVILAYFGSLLPKGTTEKMNETARQIEEMNRELQKMRIPKN